jgi:hypothetical protein
LYIILTIVLAFFAKRKLQVWSMNFINDLHYDKT